MLNFQGNGSFLFSLLSSNFRFCHMSRVILPQLRDFLQTHILCLFDSYYSVSMSKVETVILYHAQNLPGSYFLST